MNHKENIMRKDMNKVLIERPRSGGRGKQRKRHEKVYTPRVKDFDEEYDVEIDQRPGKESIRKRHKINGDYKEFSDLLGPMAKCLRSRAGRPWDDVWSEICAEMKGSGLQADHIKGHFKQMVAGIPHSGESYFRYNEWHQPDSYNPVYVDEDWILRKSPNWKKRGYRHKSKEPRYHYYRESDTVEYHKLNGCWYRVEFGDYAKEMVYKGLYSNYTRMETHYYCIKKQALSRRKAKKLDLENRHEGAAPRFPLEDAEVNRTDR